MRELAIKNIGGIGSMQKEENTDFAGERAWPVLARGQLAKI